MAEKRLPYADAATIVRANQKDTYFESSLQSQIQEVLHIFKGSRFVNTHPEEITVATKALYLALTTLVGARTLGEEYVDLIYVNRNNSKLPRLLYRIGFLLSYAVVPYFATRLARKLRKRFSKDDDESGSTESWWALYPKVLDTLMNLHVAIFYFQGEFYSLSKRIFGMRYVYGHNKDLSKSPTGNYSFLGGIILIQFLVKSILKLKTYNDDQREKAKHEEEKKNVTPGEKSILKFTKTEQLEDLKLGEIDLSDPNVLPYIPENSRSCMLCLSPMVDPASANCGHFFCWSCIVDWIREHPECPLCRQQCQEQNLLPLR